MITIKNLEFTYGKTKKVFDGLSWEINQGYVYGLLGKNGAGKTTLMKIIGGLLFPDSGFVSVNGYEPEKRYPSFLEKFIFIPEEFVVPAMSIKNYEKVYSPFYEKFDHSAFDRYLGEFELLELKDRNLTSLSYGQKKKVLISFAFAAGTELLLMDEPTNGLDIPSKSVFRKLCIEAMNSDRTFIVSTHQVKDVERIIDRITILEKGKIIADSTMEEISEKYSFKLLNSLPEEGVLYHEKTLGGYKVISENKENEMSAVDIELYFNAIIKQNSNGYESK